MQTCMPMRVILPAGDGGTEEGGLEAGRMTRTLCLTGDSDSEAAAAADGAAAAPAALLLPPVNAVAADAAPAAAVILAGRSVSDLTAC